MSFLYVCILWRGKQNENITGKKKDLSEDSNIVQEALAKQKAKFDAEKVC